MKKLLISSAIMLLTTGAFATDQHIGSTSEYYGSPLADHGPGGKSGQLSATHDHGDNTAKNFVEHGHDQRIVQTTPAGSGSGNMMPAMHDHGDNVEKNYNAHEHK
jgi:hypothetical protein